MAKKSMRERELKRDNLVAKYKAKRDAIKAELKICYKQLSEEESKGADAGDIDAIIDKIDELQLKLDKMPNNARPKRQRNRCRLTGRPRGYYRKFGLSRNMLRLLAMKGLVPGVVKSSW